MSEDIRREMRELEKRSSTICICTMIWIGPSWRTTSMTA